MALFDKLRPLFEPPIVEVPFRECEDCERRIRTEGGTCPECGGEITHDTREIPVHWGGLD